MPFFDEETPLLQASGSLPRSTQDIRDPNDIHQQFCALSGVPSSNVPKNDHRPVIVKRSLYGRAVSKRDAQNRTYIFTAALSNTLLLSQVVLGAALTALGASESSHILITLFGAANTVIAGVIAYLKSRGQPMRSRMYRDELDRFVDEMENSEIMWLGIQSSVHGYDEIAIDDSVSVRSEVARLTRLYDKVVKNNSMNDPDMYLNAIGDAASAALRGRPGPAPVNAAPPAGATVIPDATSNDPDASPASKPSASQTLPPAGNANGATPGTDSQDSKSDSKPDAKPDSSPDSSPDPKPDLKPDSPPDSESAAAQENGGPP